MAPTQTFDLIPGVRKIAVVRANAIGDFIFALPALEALRAAYPRAEIVLLGQEWHARLLRGRPVPIDRVAVIPPLRGVSLSDAVEDDGEAYSPEVHRFLAEMREEHFDLAIQMHGGGGYSNPFTLQLGARVTVGLKTPDAPPLDRWLPYLYWQREVLRYLELVSLVGAKPVTIEPRLAVTAEDLEESYSVVPESVRRLVVIHPGVGDSSRRWPAARFAAVGDALASRGAHVLVTAGRPEERELVDAVVERMEQPAKAVWARLSLGGLAGLLSRSDLLVGNDSGPLHLAGAVGTSTVGIFWWGNLLTAGPTTQGRHRQAVSWRMQCPQCGSNLLEEPCGHKISFVDDVTVEEVTTASLELFENEGLRRRNAPSVRIVDGLADFAWADQAGA